MNVQVTIQSAVIPTMATLGADEVYMDDGPSNFDGLCGLSPSAFGSDSDLLVDQLYQNSLIPFKMFSIYLISDGDPYIYFGGYENDMVTSTLVWLPLTGDTYDTEGFWSIKANSIIYEGNKAISMNYDVVIDSGTTLMYVDQATFNKLVNPIVKMQFDTCQVDDDYGIFYCLSCPLISEFKNVYVNFDHGV